MQHAHALSERAKLVKLADKICNVDDIVTAPPAEKMNVPWVALVESSFFCS